MMNYGRLNKDNTIELITMNEFLDRNSGCSLSDQVQKDNVNTQLGRFTVSTVFLGMSWTGKDWFEIMVFGPCDEEIQFRCETYEEALELHKIALGMVYEGFDDPHGTKLNHQQLAYLGEKKCCLDALPEHEQFHCLML